MAQSPRTVPNGQVSIQIGLVAIPVTIGKATADTREKNLIEVNVDAEGNAERILKNEHLASGKAITHKQRAVQIEEGKFRVLNDGELADIEAATNSRTIEVLDVQPMRYLPTVFSQGTYYVRFNEKTKTSPYAFALLCAALAKSGSGMVAKWGSSTRERLCIMSVEAGVMVLRTVPMKTDVRLASTLERQHMKVQIDENDPHFQNMCKLLDLTRKPKFDYAAYEDEALKLRQQAVDRIMAGIDPEPQPEEDSDPGEALDQLEATLSQLMEA